MLVPRIDWQAPGRRKLPTDSGNYISLAGHAEARGITAKADSFPAHSCRSVRDGVGTQICSLLLALLGELPSPLQNLAMQALGGELCFQHGSHASSPRLLQPRQFSLLSFLGQLPLFVNSLNSLRRLGQFLFEVAQDHFQLRVADQPRISAVLFKQRQILVPRRQMRTGRVSLP